MPPFSPYKERTVIELRNTLRARKLKAGGRKNELVDRLTQNDLDHPFPFLRLPAEIRNIIYEYIIAIETDWDPMSAQAQGNRIRAFNQSQIEQPGLFQICRQTRQEAMPLFYWNRPFTFILPLKMSDAFVRTGLQGFLNGLQLEFRPKVRKIAFKVTRRNANSTLTLQRFMNGMKHTYLPNTTITLYTQHSEQLKHIARLADYYMEANTSWNLLMRYQRDGVWHSEPEVIEFDERLQRKRIRWSLAAIDFAPPDNTKGN